MKDKDKTKTINDDRVIKELEVTINEKDLGVSIDPLLNFDIHISNITRKARQISGLIVKSITYLLLFVCLSYNAIMTDLFH